MSEENKGVEAPIVPAPDDKGVEATPQGAPVEGQIDYKAELEKAQDLLKKTETDRDHYREGLLNLKNKKQEADPTGTDPEPTVDVDQIVEDRLQKFQGDMVQDTVQLILESLTGDVNERALILHHYNHSINKTGFTRQQIRDDLLSAQLIANKPKYLAARGEADAAALSNATITNSGGGSNAAQRPGAAIEYKLNPQEEIIFNRLNTRRTRRGDKPLTVAEFLHK